MEEPTAGPSPASERRICRTCVGEPSLSGDIERRGITGVCSYCGIEDQTLGISYIADRVDSIITDFYRRTDFDPDDGRSQGQPVARTINLLTESFDEAFAEDVRSELLQRHIREWDQSADESNPFHADARYVRDEYGSSWDFHREWDLLDSSLKTEARFFNKRAEQTLYSVFHAIDSYPTSPARPIVVEAGPGTNLTTLYRARAFQNEKELRAAMARPDKEVGPPPATRAIAGRMNAAGVAVFYGALDPEVALAEVRPAVGSKVLIGGFEIIQPLKLLDLTALNDLKCEPGSLFDEAYRLRLKRAGFLRQLSALLSKPVMLTDEPTEYLLTQAIAEYLESADCPPLPLDGIIYPAIQAGYDARTRFLPSLVIQLRPRKVNVVLFHKVARVERIPPNATVNDDSWYGLFGHFDDRPELKYTVWEAAGESPEGAGEFADDVTLRCTSLEVRYVKAVSFESTGSIVPRFEADQGESTT
jgi:hypothetical protein